MTDFKTFPTPTRYWRLKSTKLRVVNFQFDIDFLKIILIEFPDITGSNNIHCKLIAFHHSGSGLLFSYKWKWLLYAVFIWVQLRRIWIIPFNLHALPFGKQVNTIGRVSLIKSMNNERKMGRDVCVFIPCSNCPVTWVYIFLRLRSLEYEMIARCIGLGYVCEFDTNLKVYLKVIILKTARNLRFYVYDTTIVASFPLKYLNEWIFSWHSRTRYRKTKPVHLPRLELYHCISIVSNKNQFLAKRSFDILRAFVITRVYLWLNIYEGPCDGIEYIYYSAVSL